MKLSLLQIPGGNTTSTNACAQQYGVDQSVFGDNMAGVGSRGDCENLPENLRAGCQWRFDWFRDASFPRYLIPPRHIGNCLIQYSAEFKRVVCPAEVTAKTDCVRNDDKVLSGEISSASDLTPTFFTMASFFTILLGLLSI